MLENQDEIAAAGLQDRDIMLLIQRIDSSNEFKSMQMKKGKSYSLVKKVKITLPDCYNRAMNDRANNKFETEPDLVVPEVHLFS